MALPWHISLEAAPYGKTKSVSQQPTLLKHYCNLTIHDSPCEELQTGLMCDVGINNRDPIAIQRLIASGMTVARLNMRDLEPDTCAQIIQSIRQAVYNYSAELEYVYPLAIIADVRGPDIVTGNLKNGPNSIVEIIVNETIRLTTDISWRENGTADCLYVGYDHLTELQPEDVLYLDSLTPGKIKLTVSKVGDDSVECLVASGGTIRSKMAVQISQVPREIQNYNDERGDKESISYSESSHQRFEHMEEQIAWVVAADIDAMLVTDVQCVNDVRQVKELLSEKGKHILVYACINSILGFDNIDDLLTVADGIYLDRCVLSTNLPIEKIFIAQKVIFAKCNELGKPCLCKAVINEQIPTLCVTDIANLILDGADVLYLELYYDSPLRKFEHSNDAVHMAEHCLAAAAVICRHAERILWQPRVYGNLELMQNPLEDPTKAICISAIELAMRSCAVVIICLTSSGRTAKILSHIKPPCPIIAVTRACHTARQMRFYRGVRAMHYFETAKGTWASEVDARIQAALDYCKAKRVLRAGEPYIIVTGSRRGIGYCDSIRLLYASTRSTVLVE